MEIEEVAERDPSAIHREPIDGVLGALPFQARAVAKRARADRRRVQEVRRFRAEADALLHRHGRIAGRDQSADGHREGNVFALDCKMNFDDNAMFPPARI